uniref:TLR23h n=1 Tax=Mugilogobius chulae TaxID=88201 RepID=A0A9E8DAU2_9GOBI|nr:TLR23h [Mugilogobius chulae]
MFLTLLLVQMFLSFDCFWTFTLKSCSMEFSDTVAVICQNGHLQEIPDDVPLNCEVLIVSVNNITRIKRTDVNRFTQLSVLRASRNHLSHIDDEAFVNSQKLKILDLSHNKLTNLTELMFVGLNQLISLNLMANHISQIASNVFQHLSIIDRVVLDSNDIENLTEIATIFTLPNINSISLNNNHFTSINSDDLPFASSNVTFLSALSHRLNKFILKRNIFPNLGSLKLKTGIFTEWRVDSDAYLSSVIDLYLNKLSLASFSAILNSTVSLQNLTLSGLDQQTMKLFTQVACSTTSITTLALTFSPLHFTDDEFFTSCSQLHNLKMPSSFLSDMSDQSLKPLTQLRLLQLDVNNLVKVPVTVRNLLTLETLDLNKNSIHEISCLDFANLTKLINLSLRKNEIVHLEECLFQNLHNLQTLDLSQNSVHTIQNAFRVGMTQLRILLLSNNKDQFTLRVGEFRNLSSLRVLNLKSTNRIFTVDGVFEGMETLVHLICWTSVITKEFFGGLRDLIYLELHMDSFLPNTESDGNSTDKPPFEHLPNLTQLSIYVQPRYTADFSPDVFRGLKVLYKLNTKHYFKGLIDARTFTHTPLLTQLSITNSDIFFLSPQVFTPILKLQMLDLSDNKLNTLDFLAGLKSLQMLTANDNHLSVINENFFQTLPSLTYVDLSGNVLLCDCLNAGFLQWLRSNNQTQVVGGAQYQCVSPLTQTLHRFLDFDIRQCSINVELILFTSSFSVTLLTLIMAFIFHFLRFQLAYAYYLFLAHLYDTKKQRKRDPAHRYDAFVSYNVHDEEWVYRELLPVLEGEQGWKLCLHHRDFQPGKPIVENITDAIYSSRKTLCVISRHYLQSEWCSREIQMASVRLFDEHKDVLLLVFLEDLPPWHLSPYYQMRRLMKKRSYLSWPRAAQSKDLFWHKLRQALETDINADDQRHQILQPQD